MSNFRANRRAERELARGMKMAAWLGSIADEAAADARTLVPVASGDLRDSIRSSVGTHEGDIAGIVAYGVGGEGWYGNLVEYGTSRTTPHPFLFPAVLKAVAKRGGRMGL